MALKYQKDNSIVTPWSFTQKHTTPFLCYRQGGTTYYTPLVTLTNGVVIDGYRYKYDYTHYGKSIAVRYNGNTYFVPNDRFQETADIPAGTYSPSTFESLITKFISYNGQRAAAQDFSVRVNGQTVSVKAGEYVYYTVNSSSPMGQVRHVGFNKKYTLQEYSCDPNAGFSSQAQYVTYCMTGSGFRFVQLYKTYAQYSITVITPIYFK